MFNSYLPDPNQCVTFSSTTPLRQFGCFWHWKVPDQSLGRGDQAAAWWELGALWKASVTPVPQTLTWQYRGTSALWGSTETKPSSFCFEVILLICFSCLLPLSFPQYPKPSHNILLCGFSQLEELPSLSLHCLCASHSSVKCVCNSESWGVRKGCIIKQLGKFTCQGTNSRKDNFFLSWS